VTVIYLTRGEVGIKGKSMREAAAVRTKESEAACKIIGAKPVFAGQVDGCTEFNRTRVRQLQDLLSAEDPDIMFTHWPIDTHVDHLVASACAFLASMDLQHPPQCYFYEVNTGDQSLDSVLISTSTSLLSRRRKSRPYPLTSVRMAKRCGSITIKPSPISEGERPVLLLQKHSSI
jgi:LmbE family N-acetylglucosaminyl deacetylase